MLLITEPSAPPANVSGRNASSTSIFVEWDQVPAGDKNGELVSYTIIYIEIPGGSPKAKNVTATANHTTLTGLNIYTNYSITVFASTSKGDGIPSPPIFVITDEDSKLNFLFAIKTTHILFPTKVIKEKTISFQLNGDKYV